MTLSFAPERIETWPLARLQPSAKNAKVHGPDQVAKIAASMAEFGWTVPCLVAEDGELIAGHGRVLAATQLGLTEAPVIVLGHLTEAQRRAYRIADNKLTELGTWDDLTIRWTRRSRSLSADSWGGLEVPLAEELEAYEVEVLDGATVKRVLSTSTASAVYTAAQQTADWGAPLGPGDSLNIRIFQLSALIGRGAPKTVTLTF